MDRSVSDDVRVTTPADAEQAPKAAEGVVGQALVSVVIPSKNRAGLLCEAIDSLLAQTYPNWEAVVVDDGSTDDSVAVATARYAGDPRVHIRLREGERGGAPVCRNQGFAASRGKYVIFLDSDDILAPFCLAQRVPVMEADPSLAFATYPAELFAETPGDLAVMWNVLGAPEDDLRRFLCWDTPWQTTGPIWTRWAAEQLGGWDESLPSWQDAEWHVRSLLRGWRYVAVDRRDHYVRRSARSKDNISRQDSRPDHLENRERIFCNQVRQLREANAFTPEYGSLLTASFLTLAREWIWSYSNRPRALAVWRTCRDAGLIGGAGFVEGALALRWFAHRRLLGRAFDQYAWKRWPGSRRVGTVPTAGCVPARYDGLGSPIPVPAG